MMVTVVPRAESGAFRDTTLIYLDGRIDQAAPDRLSRALEGVNGKIAIWLNSGGGNLFAGMQLGRLIRARAASTHIIDHRSLLPGECYSACSLTFLGGIYRFNENGARYGVHRASLGAEGDEADLAPDLSAAVAAYIREMGVDTRLLDLWLKARPDEMYILSRREAEDLGVVNNGRKPPAWSLATLAGGHRLQGQQVTIDGTGTVFFSCDKKQIVFGSVHEAAGKGERIDARGWSHWLTLDGKEMPVTALRVSGDDGFVTATFVLAPDLVRLARAATRIGHRMRPPASRSPAIGHDIDIDDRSAATVRKFLGDCLRGRAG
jgi:ATP-dependent protease ClpP protease subunit